MSLNKQVNVCTAQCKSSVVRSVSKNLKDKGGYARSRLEPEPCGHRIVECVRMNTHKQCQKRQHAIWISPDFVRQTEDPAKMTDSKMALVRRG